MKWVSVVTEGKTDAWGTARKTWKPGSRSVLLTDSSIHKHLLCARLWTKHWLTGSSADLVSSFELLTAQITGLSFTHVQDTALPQNYSSVLLWLYSSIPL